MEQLFIDAGYVRENLSPVVCIGLMEEVLKEQDDGSFVQYIRNQTVFPDSNIFGVMPAYSGKYFGAKVLSVYPDNFKRGLPSHQGAILLFEEETGKLIATVDAGMVTKIRTGAVSAVASKYLAVKRPEVLCIIGCGEQGESHIEALSEVFEFSRINLFDMSKDRAYSLMEKACSGKNAVVCNSVEEAAAEADIICTLTPGNTIVLEESMVKKGAHINAVGACAPAKRELSSELVRRSRFFCDNVDSVMKESGDLLYPLHEGLVGEDHILGTIGACINGKTFIRNEDDITVFEALGMAVEDLKCAIYLYEKKRGLL
ncbi:MAG: ornithine cyclodeaminase family protein [Clostridia bacterium]|nr:ornithine cyclodeaminase family protein [Clostridia bacterium]